MKNFIIKTIEGTRYKVTLNVAGVQDLGEYQVYGSCQPIGGCDKCTTPFTVGEEAENSVVMYVEPLLSGSYQYQIFIKRVTTNQEFEVLQGRIEVAKRIGSYEVSNSPQSSEVEVTLNADTVEVNV